MKIYISHSSAFDFQNRLYSPIKAFAINSPLQFYFPHEFSIEPHNTKLIIKNSDLVLAEVSYPSTGQGIELGWANIFEIPILGIHNPTLEVSNSLKFILSNILSYQTERELHDILLKI